MVEQDEVWRDFFQTELMTGLRRGEICGLQWSDFNGDTGTLKVCRTLHSQRKGEYTVGETKNGKGNAYYPPAEDGGGHPAAAQSGRHQSMDIPRPSEAGRPC